MLPFTRSDLERLFPPANWTRGDDLFRENQVLEVSIERDGRSIRGRVRGAKRTPYITRVKVVNGRGGRVRVESTCTCIACSDCEHAAALLMAALNKTAAPDLDEGGAALDNELEAWMNAVQQALRKPTGENGASSSETILYLLEPAQRSWRDMGLAQPVLVRASKARRLKGGGVGREQTFAFGNLTVAEPAPFVTIDDQVIGRLLGAGQGNVKRLSSIADGEALRMMIETGRCHWKSGRSQALTIGQSRKAELVWRFDSEGRQRLHCVVKGGSEETVVLNLTQPWYVDLEQGSCGPLETGLGDQLSRLMYNAPAVPPDAASLVRQKLGSMNGVKLPLPEQLRARERVEAKPTPVLHLHCPKVTVTRGAGWKKEEQEVDLPLARLSFDYQGAEVGWQESRTELNHVADNRLIMMPRATLDEVANVEKLNALGLQPLGPTGLGRFANQECRQDFTFEEDDDEGDLGFKWVEFNHHHVPKLAEAGWRISYSDDYPYAVAEADGPIQADVTETDIDWFELDLGVEVGGERFPLLPLLLDLFERAPEAMTPQALAEAGEEPVYATLPDNRLLAIPASRLQAMMTALYELFASGGFSEDGKVKMSRAEATRLTQIEQALDDDEVRWTGGEKLRDMARKLATMDGLPEVAQPESLAATLRGYQLEGLSWLAYLREAGVCGCLADDMGLGKTLQTLAFMLRMKERGELEDRSCLVVAPTSLIPTWRNEARKFAPQLRMLVLHGNDRKDLFEHIDDADVVLTSYALLLRDHETLLPRRWALAALDEAQAIKNPSTKLARTACRIEAEMRLCLTGTPMENHLGELWSVFSFLMPGFLGDREAFRRTFRQHIEKDGDEERQELLAARIRPFMLRRTKEKVAAELPPKTEMVREIELRDDQRDLYESVRLSMHKRVRDEIASRGLARSNIAILEALLKLRQVCCDPRLLKDKADGPPAPSAKLDLLMDMLPAMVESGRRIIIFSQFVEMLELIEGALEIEGLNHVKLTGRTKDRETPVKQFQEGDAPIFLISLKAGGTGLTLTRADTVIHYDPWWNPAVEAQATDRAHRIGQTKNVFVYKMIAAGTVEQKMIELQERKRALIQSVLQGGGAGLKFSEEDLEALFQPLPNG